MLRGSSVQSDDPAYWQIGDQSEQEGSKYRGIAFARSPQPIEKRRNQKQTGQSLELAPRGVRETRLRKSARLCLDVPIHVQIEWKQKQASVFGDGARDDDRSNE